MPCSCGICRRGGKCVFIRVNASLHVYACKCMRVCVFCSCIAVFTCLYDYFRI